MKIEQFGTFCWETQGKAWLTTTFQIHCTNGLNDVVYQSMYCSEDMLYFCFGFEQVENHVQFNGEIDTCNACDSCNTLTIS